MVTAWKADVTPTLNGASRVGLPKSSIGLQHIPQDAVSLQRDEYGMWGFLQLSVGHRKRKEHLSRQNRAKAEAPCSA